MSDAALLRAYRATMWTVYLPGEPVRLHLGARVPAALPRPLAILTAWNPASHLRSAQENQRANRRLRQVLRGAGVRCFATLAGGTGPAAHHWTEPGFAAAGLPRGRVVALGEQFGQNAVVWIGATGGAELIVTRPGFCGAVPGTVLR